MNYLQKEKRLKNIVSSRLIESNRSVFEIELLSGGRAYSNDVIATADMITFENEKGLIVSVSRSEKPEAARSKAGGE